MKRYLNTSFLAIGHGLADGTAGYLLGSDLSNYSLLHASSLIVLYNVLAFAMQLPAGILIDKYGRAKILICCSLLASALAVIVFSVSPLVSVVLMGFCSAFYHTGGGKLALETFSGEAKGTGMFASLGVLGLTIGGLLGYYGFIASSVFVVLLVSCTVGIYLIDFENVKSKVGNFSQTIGSYDLFVILLVIAIAIRSIIWNIYSSGNAINSQIILAIGVAAMLGKLLGGFLADAIGWKRYSAVCLLFAAPLLFFHEHSYIELVAGIFLLQSLTSVGVSALYKFMPSSPATVAGLTFGVAIALGSVSDVFRSQLGNLNNAILIVFLILILGSYWISISKIEKIEKPN